MSTAALKSVPHPGASDYLGPATVAEVLPGGAEVDLPGGQRVTARLALAFPYRPVAGDTLLVIGKDEDHYVIGVLSGQGHTALTFQGDVTLTAEGGALSLAGTEGVHLRGPEVSLDSRTIRMHAEALVQKLGSVYQRVSALLSVRAREAETLVDEGSLTRAKTATILTEETMSINGKQIHLG